MTAIHERFRSDPLYFEKTERGGLEIWYRQEADARKFGIAVLFRNAGSLSTPIFKKWETAHLLEHLLFHDVASPDGKFSFSSEQDFHKHLFRQAYVSQGKTTPRFVQYSLTGPTSDFEEICSLMGGILQLCVAHPDQWHLAKQHVHSELVCYKSNGSRNFWRSSLQGNEIELLNDNKVHAENLEQISEDDVQGLYCDAYVAENCTVMLGGYFPDELLDRIPKLLEIPQNPNQTLQAPLSPLAPAPPRKDTVILPGEKDGPLRHTVAFLVPAQAGSRDRAIAEFLVPLITDQLFHFQRSLGLYASNQEHRVTLTSPNSLFDVAGQHILEIMYTLPRLPNWANVSDLEDVDALEGILEKLPKDLDLLDTTLLSCRRGLQTLGDSRDEVARLAIQSLIEHRRVLSLQDRLAMLIDLSADEIAEYAQKHLRFEVSYRACFDPNCYRVEAEESAKLAVPGSPQQPETPDKPK